MLNAPISTSAALRSIVFCVLASTCLHAYAQMPSDDDTWKSRCMALSASADAIDKGSAPPALLQTTGGIIGDKFAAVAHERAEARQHYIACTLYYTAAMAEHMGNGGRIDVSKAHTDIVLAGVELKQATGQPLTFSEKMNRASLKLPSMSAKKTTLTPADVASVFGVFGNGPPPAPGAPPGPPASGAANPGAQSPPPQRN